MTQNSITEEKRTVQNTVTEERRRQSETQSQKKKKIKKQHQTYFSEEKNFMHRS